jgi:hypothetical protein
MKKEILPKCIDHLPVRRQIIWDTFEFLVTEALARFVRINLCSLQAMLQVVILSLRLISRAFLHHSKFLNSAHTSFAPARLTSDGFTAFCSLPPKRSLVEPGRVSIIENWASHA